MHACTVLTQGEEQQRIKDRLGGSDESHHHFFHLAILPQEENWSKRTGNFDHTREVTAEIPTGTSKVEQRHDEYGKVNSVPGVLHVGAAQMPRVSAKWHQWTGYFGLAASGPRHSEFWRRI